MVVVVVVPSSFFFSGDECNRIRWVNRIALPGVDQACTVVTDRLVSSHRSNGRFNDADDGGGGGGSSSINRLIVIIAAIALDKTVYVGHKG